MYTDPAWRAERLAQALTDGRTVAVGHDLVTLRHHHAGDLIVTSGTIVACDPGWIDEDTQPFVTRIEPGRHPVVLSIAHFPGGNQRVAYATLRVQNHSPARSEIAQRLNDDAYAQTVNGEGYIPNYPVDTGKGCLLDADVLRLLVEQQHDESVYEQMNIGPGYDDLIREAIDKTYMNGWGWANLTVDPTTGANIIAFSSGEGDGGYATYVGYDNNNAIVCFTTDFALLGEES